MSADSPQVAKAIRIASLLLWLPHVIPLLVTDFTFANSNHLGLLIKIGLATTVTSIVAAKLPGDWLMVIAFVVGILTELAGYGMESAVKGDAGLDRRFWMVASAFHGLFAGILCKAKDIHDERYRPGYSIAERLYIVFPFTFGLWTGYVSVSGWSGVLVVFSSIFLCLATVGYGVVAQRLFRYYFAGQSIDLIDLITRMFTTSFGAVFSSLFIAIFLSVYLAIPFVSALLKLNALVSSIGIIVEIVVYDLA